MRRRKVKYKLMKNPNISANFKAMGVKKKFGWESQQPFPVKAVSEPNNLTGVRLIFICYHQAKQFMLNLNLNRILKDYYLLKNESALMKFNRN